MEERQQQQQGKKRRRRRRKKKNNNGGGRRRNRENYYSFDSPSSDDDDDTNMRTMFPEMLSSLLNLHTQFAQSLLKKCLQKLLQSLNHQTLIIENSLLSLLPHLLLTTIHYPSLTRRTSEIIGAISLSSFEANERIASDDEILKALMASLSNRCKSVAMAACNAVLDISTTSIGRKRLCEVSAVEKLISVFLQAATSPAKYDFLHIIGNGVNNFPVLALDTTMALINNCDMDQLVLISKKSCEIFLRYLKELWAIVQVQILPTDFAECSRGKPSSLTNVRIHDLAETIFRLSINPSHCSISCTSEVVKRNIFGPNLSDLENFMLNCWEMSPCLFRRLSVPVNEHDDIFSSFVQSFNSKRTLDVLLPSMLRGLVSCPPFPSDDLDIISFLKEVKDGLGLPLVYEQDIRVLKTVDVIPKTNQEDLKKEVHFLNEHTSFSKMNDPDFLTIGDVRKCKEAFQEGYTIALRGMEFRLESIAAIADGLAVLFGQPSIGANAYLTPPNSQGLARHYDDHCVFVCQLLGQKQWKVFTRPTLLLPRLYEPLGNLVGSGGGGAAPECKQFLLDEGDILYIPRGCPHEACTTAEMDDASTRFSLHLTLGIEVEPPFEWEGFAHVALHCWNQKQKPHTPIGSLLGKLNLLAIYLLHVSIQLIGRRDPVFQKACMVASFSLPSDNEENQRSDVLDLNQRNTFSYVINCINKEARFLEAFGIVEQSIQENKEDLFQRMGWLRHLQEADKEEGLDWTNPLMEFEDLYRLYNRNRDDAEAAFMQVKSKFCKEVIFKDVCESFKILLQKYRKVRKQYMNGMLSLHCI